MDNIGVQSTLYNKSMQNNGHYHINYGEPLKQTGRVKVD